mmetsp:Transcript_31966/g.53919  ORF Transcript_31966/g.53919 Transcript_31966/m.53919 type:complete len:202 (-) Transcript_31966:912-1517(-)
MDQKALSSARCGGAAATTATAPSSSCATTATQQHPTAAAARSLSLVTDFHFLALFEPIPVHIFENIVNHKNGQTGNAMADGRHCLIDRKLRVVAFFHVCRTATSAVATAHFSRGVTATTECKISSSRCTIRINCRQKAFAILAHEHRDYRATQRRRKDAMLKRRPAFVFCCVRDIARQSAIGPIPPVLIVERSRARVSHSW